MAKDLTIVLVHGAWSDGSQWRHVVPVLVEAGYKVRCVQNNLTSLQEDIDKTNDLIDLQDSNVLLVGHSYGGAVISGAGNNDNVVGLVYIAAFAPDAEENIAGLLEKRSGSGGASIYSDTKGFFWIKYDEFHQALCQDLDKQTARIMALTQRPINGQCFGDKTKVPAWKNKPTWYQVSNNDNMIPVQTQKEMAERISAKKIIYLESGHISAVSQPEAVSELILEAAASL
ncbi:Pimeloyl-ACP methyl ester carboxylesterase [Flavobacterium saccharophilum]|uniref:Pimeloyl-ACP methyl ester carboxylesterase n=2 Tax=Flavobacterium saccharophilum TaxID=29534 RepID=A0A1M7FUD4_9FLAO|nr:Pimeloyl-ACP methyl ester carboxylesterase [Flavobacterium saccharophilum]